MKKAMILLAVVLITATTWAQSPQKMSYQAVIRNGSNILVTNTIVGMQLSILQGTATGTVVYAETQTPTTNANGLITIDIGTGTPVIGNFSSINWSAGPYFIKTETDPAGGSTYSITGTSQLLSVPYALYAKTAEHIKGKCSGYIGQNTEGGIVFYLDESACHGLVAKSTDEQGTFQWAINETKYTGAYANAPFGGKFNFHAIKNTYAAPGSAPANEICENLITGSGAYDDWYLPSEYELFLMFTNIGQGSTLSNIGNFSNSIYWSSTEANSAMSWGVDFGGGGGPETTYPRTNSYNVRAIRSF